MLIFLYARQHNIFRHHARHIGSRPPQRRLRYFQAVSREARFASSTRALRTPAQTSRRQLCVRAGAPDADISMIISMRPLLRDDERFE